MGAAGRKTPDRGFARPGVLVLWLQNSRGFSGSADGFPPADADQAQQAGAQDPDGSRDGNSGTGAAVNNLAHAGEGHPVAVATEEVVPIWKRTAAELHAQVAVVSA